MNASLPAGNNGIDVHDGRVQLENSSAASRFVQPAAFQTFTAMKCV